MSWGASAAAKELVKGIHGEPLSMADKLVLMILSENYIEEKGYVWCSQKQLAKCCVCSERGLRGVLDRLERFELVKTFHRGRLGNYYNLLFMRNGVPQSVDDIEEPRSSIMVTNLPIEEPRSSITERYKEGMVWYGRYAPPNQNQYQTNVRELWKEMRRVCKRGGGPSIGDGLRGPKGEQFLDLVRKHGTEKILGGFREFVEHEGKNGLRHCRAPAIVFLSQAEGWIEDAQTTEQPEPESASQVAGPRGPAQQYQYLIKH